MILSVSHIIQNHKVVQLKDDREFQKFDLQWYMLYHLLLLIEIDTRNHRFFRVTDIIGLYGFWTMKKCSNTSMVVDMLKMVIILERDVREFYNLRH